MIVLLSILAGSGAGLFLSWRKDGEAGHPPFTPEKRWRVGYYEGGAAMEYPLHLRALIRGLVESGYIEPMDLPIVHGATDSRDLWDCLFHANSAYIEFVTDAFWTADWDEAKRARNQRDCLHRLTRTGDIDLMLAMGTWAGQDLATDVHSTPTMVLACSDPVRSGIVRDPRRSGLSHVHAKCDPSRYIRQVRAFHNLTGFKRLGVVYEDSFEGPIYSNLAELNLVAAERGFEVVAMAVKEQGLSDEACMREVMACYRQLAPQIDAFWVAPNRGEDPGFMPRILEPLLDAAIPTWSQLGTMHVRRGVLMSISERNYEDVGRFHAGVIGRILRGEAPGSIGQIFEDPKAIAINLATARKIGYQIPIGMVAVADEVFSSIEGES